MRKITIVFLAVSLLLAGCGLKAKEPAPESIQPASIFEVTPTSHGSKGEIAAAQPHSITTSVALTAYPTPLSTYLVPARNLPTTPAVTVLPATATPVRTATVVDSPTATPIAPTATSVLPSATVSAGFAYQVQPGTPAYTTNFNNTAAGCNWQGIAGQVFDESGQPVMNVVVKAGGTWNGSNVNQITLTGSAAQYGAGGYELTLGSKAINSTGTAWVQLYDTATNPVSPRINLNTYADCTMNLAVINFVSTAGGYRYYVPLVMVTATP